VLLGATSLDDLLGRLDTASRVSDQRSSVVGDVLTFQSYAKRLAATLKRAQSEQQQVVARRAAERRAIEAQLAERQRLLSSAQSEIAHLRVVEASRQLSLARAARGRIGVQPWSPSGGTLGVGAGITEATTAP